jgi:hypothetical protein
MLTGHSGTTLLDAALIHSGDGPLDPRTAKDGRAGSPKMVLNLRFVEALQGFPLGWTDPAGLDSVPSETPSSPK